MGDTHAPPPMDVLVPVPPIVSRRAWECAFALASEHSSTIGNADLWLYLQDIAAREPESMTWAECRAMFTLYRAFRRGGAHA